MSVNEVLERNLKALFKRSYVPVLPEPHFRERVIGLVLEELDRRHGRLSKKRVWPQRLAIAAALLVTFGAALFLTADLSPTVSELLARGSEAVRGTDGDWRAATSDERERGVRAPWLAAATPVDGELELALDAGAVVLAGSARVNLTSNSEALVLGLTRGSVDLRHGGALPWRLETRHGDVLLENGELFVRYLDPILEVELDTGVAQLEVGGTRIAMQAGDVRRFGPGGLIPPALAAGDTPATTAPNTKASERRGVAAAPGLPVVPSTKNRWIVRAIDGESGAPIRTGTLALLAEQQLNRPDPARTESFESQDGRATWQGEIPDGRYFAFVHAEGRALFHAGAITFGEGSREHVVEARLEPGATRNGFVVDEQSGEPMSGAWVISFKDTPAWGLPFHDPVEADVWSGASTHTRLDGSFTLEHLSPGTHVLQASVPGRAPTWIEIEVDARSEERLTDIALTGGGAVRGTMTDATAAPIINEQVVAFATEGPARDLMAYGYTRTDAEGRYEMRDLPEGTMLIIRPGQTVGAFPEVKPAEVHAGATVEIDFLGHVTGTTLQGQLVRADGSPLPSTNLGCFRLGSAGWDEEWIASTSRSDGSFHFEDLAPADYAIYASGEYGETLTLLGELTVPNVEIHTARIVVGANRIFGTVQDGLHGEPVDAMILFELHGANGTRFAGMTRTKDDGSYELEGIPDGSFRVTAYPIGEGPTLFGFENVPAIESSAAEPLELDLVCWPGARASIRVTTPDGEPFAGADITFEDADGQTFAFGRSSTDTNGRHEAIGLRPGTYTLEVRAPGFRRIDRSIDAREGRPLEIELILQPDSQPTEPAEPRGDER